MRSSRLGKAVHLVCLAQYARSGRNFLLTFRPFITTKDFHTISNCQILDTCTKHRVQKQENTNVYLHLHNSQDSLIFRIVHSVRITQVVDPVPQVEHQKRHHVHEAERRVHHQALRVVVVAADHAHAAAKFLQKF